MWGRLKFAGIPISIITFWSQGFNTQSPALCQNRSTQSVDSADKETFKLRNPSETRPPEATRTAIPSKPQPKASSSSPELINLIGIPDSERGYVGTCIGVLHALSIAASVTRLGYVAYHKRPNSSNILPFMVIGACTYLYFGYFQDAVVGLDLNTTDKTLNIVKGLTAQKKHKIKAHNLRLVEGDLSWAGMPDRPRDALVVEFRTSESAHWQTGHLLSETLLSKVFSQQPYDRQMLAVVLRGELNPTSTSLGQK